jgi:hypothetical protein
MFVLTARCPLNAHELFIVFVGHYVLDAVRDCGQREKVREADDPKD